MSWDAQIELLKIQYKALRPKEREIRDEEAAEAKRRANLRIREVRQALADDFKRYREGGMPQYAIQEVLGTRDWGTLTQWRELMNMESPKDIRNAEKISKQGWTYEDGILILTRDHEGTEIEPLEFDYAAWDEKGRGGMPVAVNEADFLRVGRSYTDPHAFRKHVITILEGL